MHTWNGGGHADDWAAPRATAAWTVLCTFARTISKQISMIAEGRTFRFSAFRKQPS